MAGTAGGNPKNVPPPTFKPAVVTKITPPTPDPQRPALGGPQAPNPYKARPDYHGDSDVDGADGPDYVIPAVNQQEQE